MREYLVIFERAEDGGWGAYLPDLPGVVALGASRDEVAARIKEALDAYAQEMADLRSEHRSPNRLPPPEPSKSPEAQARTRRMIHDSLIAQNP
jgi:predicted RNase H-like HicB family nuclease